MTTFAIIMHSQVRENYAFTEDGYMDTDNPYWKFKGGHETILAEDLSAQDVVDMGTDKIKEMCSQHEDFNCRNGSYELDFLEYEIVEIGHDLLEKAKKAIDDDWGWIKRGNKVSDIGLEHAASISRYEARKAIPLLGYEIGSDF